MRATALLQPKTVELPLETAEADYH